MLAGMFATVLFAVFLVVVAAVPLGLIPLSQGDLNMVVPGTTG
jgi:hypothetical protein